MSRKDYIPHRDVEHTWDTDLVLDGQPVYFDFTDSRFHWKECYGDTVAEVQREYDNIQLEKEARRESAALTRQQKPPVDEVSVVTLWGNFEGDCLLRGWHGSTGTPLLSKPNGTVIKKDPSSLRNVSVLRRLAEHEWTEWKRLKAEREAATELFEHTGRSEADLIIRSTTKKRTLVASIGSGSTAQFLREVPFKLVGQHLVAPFDDQTLVADSVRGLIALIRPLVHPDQGLPVVIGQVRSKLEEDDALRLATFDANKEDYTYLDHLWFDTSIGDVSVRNYRRLATDMAARDFIADRVVRR